MSHADKRSPSTDALETLGMIHFKPEARDAIHLAVEPVIAATTLAAGEKIGVISGKAYPVGRRVVDGEEMTVPYHGIVDPFLPTPGGGNIAVLPGQSFWFVMAPRMVTSLRHVWEHPAFPEGK